MEEAVRSKVEDVRRAWAAHTQSASYIKQTKREDEARERRLEKHRRKYQRACAAEEARRHDSTSKSG
jgi:hypothetical protein